MLVAPLLRFECSASEVSNNSFPGSSGKLVDRAAANSFLPAYRGVLIARREGIKGISGLRSTRGAQDEYNFYWLDSRGRDTTAVVAQDLASGTMRVLAEDPRADFTELLLDPISERPVAAARSFERVAWQVLDPILRSFYTMVVRVPRNVSG